MPATLNSEYEVYFNNLLLDGYGITETSTMVTMNWKSNRKIGSCGIPIPGMSVRIISSQNVEAGPNEEGELICYGPNLMVGYHNKEDETKKVSEGDQEIISKIQKHLGDKVSDVIISKRLTDSASCIVLPKHEPGAQLRKILEASGQTLGSSNPIFEINMKHKLVKKLKDMKGKQFNSFVDFLYDYAVIAEGGSPQDPSKYLRQLDKYLS